MAMTFHEAGRVCLRASRPSVSPYRTLQCPFSTLPSRQADKNGSGYPAGRPLSARPAASPPRSDASSPPRQDPMALTNSLLSSLQGSDYKSNKPRSTVSKHAQASRRAAVAAASLNSAEMQQKSLRTAAISREWNRKFFPGQVYSPSDLSPHEMQRSSPQALRSRQRTRGSQDDVFDILGVNPMSQYLNFAMMAEFTTGMGRIKHRTETGLRAVNQRKIAKAIRRAVGMGLIPSVHKHPEMLEEERASMIRRRGPIVL